jgi:hypothetical protein
MDPCIGQIRKESVRDLVNAPEGAIESGPSPRQEENKDLTLAAGNGYARAPARVAPAIFSQKT